MNQLNQLHLDCTAPRSRPARTRGDGPLLLAAALVSTSDGVLMVGLPFLSIALGASAWQVGLVGGLMRVIYVIGLLSGRPLLGRSRLALLGSAGCLGLTVSTMLMPSAAGMTRLLVLVAIYGLATSLFWPPLVGLLSAGLRDESLNRRLGRFNMAWSGGMVVGPWVGGALFAVSASLPFMVAAALFAIAAVAMLRAPGQEHVAEPSPARPDPRADEGAAPAVDVRTRVFLRMARIALVGGYVVLGLLRYQLPNLATEIGTGEGAFGAVGTLLSLSLAGAFLLLGRMSGWHHRAWLLWGGQVLMASSLLLPAIAGRTADLALSVIVAGQGIGLVYASHLFYGTSAGQNRARVMSAHEVLLSVGFLIGALGGGLVAEWTGTTVLGAPVSDHRTLYLVGGAVIILGVLLQISVALAGGLRTRPARRSAADEPPRH